MKDRNNPSNSKRTTGYCFRWFVSIAILTFLPMIAAMADNETPPADPVWETQAQNASVGTSDTSPTDIVVTESTSEGNQPTYTVKTAKGLAWIAWVTNEGKSRPETTMTSTEPNYDSYYPAAAGFEGCIVELADNISLALPSPQNTANNAGNSWVPIGYLYGMTEHPFKGTFNGNNKTISNLSITKEYTNYYRIGLFGYIEGGSVNDLTVAGEIKLNSYTNSSTSKYIGGIVGYSEGNINNCHNKCTIDYGSAGENYSMHVGGITGDIDKPGCSITNCSNQRKISGEKGTSCFAGGIAGIAGNNSEAISNCFNSGEIAVTAKTACVAGGIAGSNGVQLSNCYSTGAVTAKVEDSNSTNYCSAGGIIGINEYKNITNCYSTGAVSAAHSGSNSSKSCCAGGIVGLSSPYTTISNCLALNNNDDGSAAISVTATNVSIKMGRVVGEYSTTGDPSYDTKLTDNYASTLTTMPAGHTYDKGSAKKDGANIYLEDNLADILNANQTSTTPWDYTTDNLPTLKVWTGSPQQSSLSKAAYLAKAPAALDLSSDALTGNITISKNDDGEWQYKVAKAAGGTPGVTPTSQSTEPVEAGTVFTGVIKQSKPETAFTHSITVNNAEGATTTASITLSGNINIATTEEKALTFNSYTGLIIEEGAKVYLAGKTSALQISNGFNITGSLLRWSLDWNDSEQYKGCLKLYKADDKEATPYAAFDLTNTKIKGFATNVSPNTEYTLWHETDGTKTQQQGYDTFKQYQPFSVTTNNTVFLTVKPVIPVTLTQPDEGGLISVFYNNIAVPDKGGVVYGAKLQLKAYPIAGYKLEKYTVTTTIATENSQSTSTSTEITAAVGEYTVPDIMDNNTGSYIDITNITVTGSFEKDKSSATSSETTVATTTDDIPQTVDAPTAAVDPNNTTASSGSATIKLISGNLEGEEHKASLKEELQSELSSADNMIFAEIALVEITDNGGITMKPIQPKDGTTVHIVYPYPAGLDSKSTFVIVHLKTDGTTEVYKESPDASKGEQQLTKTARGLEFAVSSFSPFGISWKAYSAPSGGNDDNDDGDYTPPVYYTVTIPAVEGATTDPVAGAYEVEAWDSFGFYLTLEPAYDQSAPVVTTDRGETLSPRSSDGKYIVKYVRSDVDIAIEGITANEPPVANAVLTAGTRLWTEQQTLCIHTDTAGQLRLFTLAGSLYRTIELAPGDTRQPVPSGIYIARLNSQAIKILVP